jgi:predicted transcriptional regulator
MDNGKSEPEKVPSFKDMQEQYHAVMAFFYKDFGTKEDLRETRMELKQEIVKVEQATTEIKKELKQEIEETKKELKQDIIEAEGHLQKEINEKFTWLDRKIDKVSNDLKWFMGAMFVATTTIIGILTYLK